MLHFEFREKAEFLYKKWKKLALFENDSSSDINALWLERIATIRQYVNDYNVDEINRRWFFEHRSFWGTLIPKDKIIYDITLPIWYRKYFRRKIESGKIKSVCFVRKGHLGDVIMTEPIARFLLKYVDKIYLATELKNNNIESILNIYDKIYEFKQIKSDQIECDIMIKLVYEFSDNQKTYIQGYMESIGFGEVENKDIPILKEDWENIVNDRYILIAPFTSSWEKKKRNWGYKKFIELAKLLEKEFNIKCVILEKKYSFHEMMALIRHCNFFVGNDSAPAIIAQSFKKKSFVIFAGTRPDYLLMSKYGFPIYDFNRHKLCKHYTRQEEIDCCEEFCMERITISKVFNQIKQNL